jgi:hypothetical protein
VEEEVIVPALIQSVVPALINGVFGGVPPKPHGSVDVVVESNAPITASDMAMIEGIVHAITGI